MALGCRDMNLDLQVERSEIPIYRGCLATWVKMKQQKAAKRRAWLLNVTPLEGLQNQ